MALIGTPEEPRITQPTTEMKPHRFLRRNDVVDKTGLPVSTLYYLVSIGRFPKPVRLGLKAVAWVNDEVEAWQEARISER